MWKQLNRLIASDSQIDPLATLYTWCTLTASRHLKELLVGFCFHTGHEHLLGESSVSGPSVHPILLPIETLSLLILCQLTSSFAVMIIATTTRGRNLTRNLKMGRNKLLILLSYMVKMGFYDSSNFSTVILSFTWTISVNTVALHL